MNSKLIHSYDFREDGGFIVEYRIVSDNGIHKGELVKYVDGTEQGRAQTLPLMSEDEAKRMIDILYECKVTPMHLKYILKDSF